ncbi:MAG TPA: hypothetical protein VH000_10700 [Rhizomicrobium sp.]|nr:hypothetical protein [Rhizomicrobium sp.]
MPTAAPTAKAVRLAPQEWLFLCAVMLGVALFVLWMGKDTSWDFRNYHWYIPYQFLTGRMNLDLAVAHQASYYNPFLDIPFYLLASHTPSWFSLGVMGLVQGANCIPLYFIARSSLRMEENVLASAALTLMGMTGALTLSLYGTTYYDNVMSVFVLTGLAILVVQRDALANGSLTRTAFLAGLAGFLVGSSVGLKLPEAPFALGFAAALVALRGDFKHQAVRIAAGGIAGLIGVLLFSAYWWEAMDKLTGNPLFPYFNEYFKSPLALASPYRDMRFLPHGIFNIVTFPIQFSLNWAVADDLGFQDIRVGIAYLASIAAGVEWLVRRRAPDPLFDIEAARPLFAFAAASLISWTLFFAIYRYILSLEMLAPIVIVAAVGFLPLARRTRFVTIGVLLFAILVTSHSTFNDRMPLGDPYVQIVTPPKIEHPKDSIILMTGLAPMGYIAPSLPHQIPLLRIDGWMLQPQDGTRLTARMRKQVDDFKGDLYSLSDPDEIERTHDALLAYGFIIDWLKCQHFDTNLAGPYLFCPLTRKPPNTP